MSELTLSIRNFRGLRDVRWEIPEGLCALVGPNGSGKSTLLSALAFVRDLVKNDLPRAIQATGGLLGLRHFDAGPTDFIEFEMAFGEFQWKLSIPFNGPNPEPAFGEMLTHTDKVLVDFQPFSLKGMVNGKPSEGKAGSLVAFLPFVFDGLAPPAPHTLVATLYKVQGYAHRRALSYDIAWLRRSGSTADSETVLSDDGRSVWSVLRNWRDKRETRARFDFVIASMRDAFSEHFEDLDFEFTAQQVSGRVYVPGRKDPVPHHLFSDGWFTGLLHLCAIASTAPGGIVSIDEPENSLHPHAIRSLLRSISSWAELHRLSVVLATHSPVVLNQIKDRARVFVMEPGLAQLPVSLDEHPNHEWLSHFSIGDAYANEEVGAPKPSR